MKTPYATVIKMKEHNTEAQRHKGTVHKLLSHITQSRIFPSVTLLTAPQGTREVKFSNVQANDWLKSSNFYLLCTYFAGVSVLQVFPIIS